MNETKDLIETEELHDCIRKLSSAQSRLNYLVCVLTETDKPCALEVLELTTHVRKHIQNNFQKLRVGLDQDLYPDGAITTGDKKLKEMLDS